MRHELFELLESINPRWQQQFDSLRDAAMQYDLAPEYYDYMHSPEGRLRSLKINAPDTVNQNRLERRIRERMERRPSRANPAVQDQLDVDEWNDIE